MAIAGPTALPPADAAALLNASASALDAELSALPEPIAVWHPAAGEWCAKDVLGHLIEAERRGFAGRIRIILASDAPALETWDQNQVSRDRGDCGRALRALLDEFMTMRRDGVALVAGLRREDLRRWGRHPKVGDLPVADLLHEWVHHDKNHLRQIQANVQAFVWPHMGNAQRFSLP